jgi:tRNA-dihydrouridine synthase
MTQENGSGPIPQNDAVSMVNREIAKFSTQKEMLKITGMTGEQVYQMYAMISEGYESSMDGEDLNPKILARRKTVDELCSFYFGSFGKDESELRSGVLDDMRKKFDVYIEHLETLPGDPRVAEMLETANREREFLK